MGLPQGRNGLCVAKPSWCYGMTLWELTTMTHSAADGSHCFHDGASARAALEEALVGQPAAQAADCYIVDECVLRADVSQLSTTHNGHVAVPSLYDLSTGMPLLAPVVGLSLYLILSLFLYAGFNTVLPSASISQWKRFAATPDCYSTHSYNDCTISLHGVGLNDAIPGARQQRSAADVAYCSETGVST